MSIKQGSAADYFLEAATKLQLILAKKAVCEKDVHDLRVAARKIKTLAADFGLFFPDKCWRVRQQVAKIIRKFSPVREQQLFAKFISQLTAVECATDRCFVVDCEPLPTIGAKQREKLTKRFRKSRELLNQPLNSERLNQAISSWLEEFSTIVAGSLASLDDERLHKIRIAAKKLRYRLECFAPQQAELINHVTAIQTEIGILHDWLTFKRLLSTTNLSAAADEQAAQRIEQGILLSRERAITQTLTALPAPL
ncbi:MAG: CHAD domain-containing protein [Bacillota bacterium]